jgi:hypothetical protein
MPNFLGLDIGTTRIRAVLPVGRVINIIDNHSIFLFFLLFPFIENSAYKNSASG